VPPVTVAELDPENRVITKAIVDKSTVLGVAGMMVDEVYFKEEVRPKLVGESLQPSFPINYQDVIVTLQDGNGSRQFETHPSEGKDPEVVVPLRFAFQDLNFKIGMRSNSLEQAAKRVVMVNLSLSIIMTGLVITGIYMALRTASREMKLSRMKSDFVNQRLARIANPSRLRSRLWRISYTRMGE
jgi:hypothetical protein